MKNKHWTTKAGYKAHVVFVNDSHYCGYVEVPKDHPAHGLNYYTYGLDVEDITSDIISKLEVIKSINNISVHGGLTFSNSSIYGVDTEKDSWVFGFDAAHCGDARYVEGTLHHDVGDCVFRDIEYMADECEDLAAKLKEIR